MASNNPLDSDKKILFSETQRFRQWWLWGVMIFSLIPIVLMFFRAYYYETERSDEMLTALLIGFGVVLIAIIFIFIIRLDTQISETGVYVRFYPIHIKYKYFSWPALEKAYIRTYSPIAEYGGYGLRIGLGRNGNAYNVSGNKGLQLVFKDGRMLLIGTDKPDDLEKVLRDTRSASHATSNVTSPGS